MSRTWVPLPVAECYVPEDTPALDADPKEHMALHVLVSCPGCDAATLTTVPLPQLARCAFCDRAWRERDWLMPEPYATSFWGRVRLALAVLLHR